MRISIAMRMTAAAAMSTLLVSLSACSEEDTSPEGHESADASARDVEIRTCYSRAACVAPDRGSPPGVTEAGAPDSEVSDSGGETPSQDASTAAEDASTLPGLDAAPDSAAAPCVSRCLGGGNDGKQCCGVNIDDEACSVLGLPPCTTFCRYCD